jgi:hypothetical protein
MWLEYSDPRDSHNRPCLRLSVNVVVGKLQCALARNQTSSWQNQDHVIYFPIFSRPAGDLQPFLVLISLHPEDAEIPQSAVMGKS